LLDWCKSFLSRMRKFDSFADQLLVSGGNFLTLAVCAHVLPLSEQGKFTYVFASYMALLLLNVSAIFQGAAVRAPANKLSSYQNDLAKFQVLQSLLTSLLLSAAWLRVGSTFGWQATTTEAAWLFVYLLFQQLADFDRRSAYIFADTKRAIISSAMLYPIRVIALIAIQPDSVKQVLIVLVFSALIPGTFTIFKAGQDKFANIEKWAAELKEHLAYSRLFIAGAPLGWLWSYVPIFMLGSMHGKEQAALLASIRGISNMANVLMEQIETKVVADWARQKHFDGNDAMVASSSRLLKIGMAFWLVGIGVAMFLGQEIVTIVLGKPYASYWHLLLIGWIGYGVYFIARVSGIKHRALGANHVEFIGSLSGVVTAIIVSLLLIPVFQATGAAWVYVIIAIVMWISQLAVLRR
jgi:O-antigen/teichoic acid export membrane protein